MHCTPSHHKSTTMSKERYAKAERFLNGEQLVFGLDVKPHWLCCGTRFWFLSETPSGCEFILVDTSTGTRERAFDHELLAAELSKATDSYYTEYSLPFEEIKFVNDDEKLEFELNGTVWHCDLNSYECCKVGEADEADEGEVESPDSKLVAYVEDYNLHVRNAETGEVLASTSGGQKDYAYGSPISSPLTAAGIGQQGFFSGTSALFSPDGSRVLTHRMDERDSRKFHLYQSRSDGSDPGIRGYSYTYPLPGDENVPRAELVILDMETGTTIPIDLDPIPMLYYGSPIKPDWVWWSESSKKVYFIDRERGFSAYTLNEIDAESGESRQLIREEAEGGIEPHVTSMGKPNIRVLEDTREVLWFSRRDGWGHLYLYDAESGDCKNKITSGSWLVHDVIHVDECQRVIYFTGLGHEEGRDPYYDHFYRVSLDGGPVELLSPEDAAHTVEASPKGDFFIDTYSTTQAPPVTVLRDRSGEVVCTVEEADISSLEASGWRTPERFRVKARDGVTEVYGMLYKPTHFDQDKTYPVIDDIYAGPQTTRAFPSFAHSGEGRSRSFWHAQALAELGFIVVMIDGLGMPYRSKEFADYSYRNLADAGLEDHKAALRQLADEREYMDLEHVGVFGHSAGGYSSAHAILAHPDFFHVAVSSAGNHDHRLDKAWWIERYMGLPTDHYLEQANASIADNLEGKLLLIHGEMDENVHVASTLRLVDALIEANKDFDLLIMPNRPHACVDDPYFVRRRWDYFVRHLLDTEPPAGYRVKPIQS